MSTIVSETPSTVTPMNDRAAANIASVISGREHSLLVNELAAIADILGVPAAELVGEPPAIECPDWCVLSQDDHLRVLNVMEGLVSHDSAFEGGLSYSVQTHVDGTPTGKSPYIYTDDNDDDSLELDCVSLEEAEQVALRILATVKAAAAARAS